MAVALGLTPESEPYPNTSLLSPYLRGDRGLLMSPTPPDEILAFFADFCPADYARAGTVAARTFVLPGGTLYSRGGEIPAEEDVALAHSLEPHLRKLGLPTRLVKGKVELDGDFTVCREGETLGSGQTTLLKMFGLPIAEFKVEVVAWWEGKTGRVETREASNELPGDVEVGDAEDEEEFEGLE